MCKGKTDNHDDRRIRARNQNNHEERGGFHVVEVNSPINMSSSTWLLILLIIGGIIFYFIRKRCKVEKQRERAIEHSRMDPAYVAWQQLGQQLQPQPHYPQFPMSTFSQHPFSPPGPPQPPQPDVRALLRALQTQAPQDDAYPDARITEYREPPRRRSPQPTRQLKQVRAPAPEPLALPEPTQRSQQAKAPAPTSPPVRRRDAASPAPAPSRSVPTSPKSIADRVARECDWDIIKPADP